MASYLRFAVAVSLIAFFTPTLSYKDCGDLKIICNRKDPSCCEGSCCPLLEHFQFISPATPDNGRFPTPEPTAAAGCPGVGDQCTSSRPRGAECCAGSGTRCQFVGSDVNGNLFGTCCFPKDSKGCTVDSDCCGADNQCLSGMCLSSATAEAIRAARSLSAPVTAGSASAAAVAVAAAAAANAETVEMEQFAVDPLDGGSPENEHRGSSHWTHAVLFAAAVAVVAMVGLLTAMVCCCRAQRAKTTRTLKEIEDHSEHEMDGLSA